jgi:hypothetical protein
MKLGIELMAYDARDYGGEITPKYSQWSQILDVPATTLHGWWQKRDEIMESGGALAEQIPSMVAQKMQIGMLMAIEELNRRLPKMSTRDMLDYIKAVIPAQRLLTGKSTQNISQSISYTPPIPQHPAGQKKKK